MTNSHCEFSPPVPVDTHVKDYKVAAKIGANCLGL